MVVNVGGKTRAVSSVQISRTTRTNWASAIVHILDRLAVASGHDIEVSAGMVTIRVRTSRC